jgi:hypothetical protein
VLREVKKSESVLPVRLRYNRRHMSDARLHSYHAFGVRLISDIPLHWLGPARMPAEMDGVDLTFRRCARATMPTGPGDGELIFESIWKFDGVPFMSALRTPRGVVLRYMDDEHFLLEPDGITAYTAEMGTHPVLQSRLLSAVMAYWMEMRGVTMLHASAAKLGPGAVAFVADSGTGKSTIAAHLAACGAEMMSDDLLACGVSATAATAWSSFPSLRLWPDQAQHFFGTTDDMELVTPLETKLRLNLGPGGHGRFCATAQPLLGIYILERVQGPANDVVVRTMNVAEAVRSLTQHSFARRITRASGLSAARFGTLARLVERVPVRKLIYRTGMDNLPNVIAAVQREATSVRSVA